MPTARAPDGPVAGDATVGNGGAQGAHVDPAAVRDAFAGAADRLIGGDDAVVNRGRPGRAKYLDPTTESECVKAVARWADAADDLIVGDQAVVHGQAAITHHDAAAEALTARPSKRSVAGD